VWSAESRVRAYCARCVYRYRCIVSVSHWAERQHGRDSRSACSAHGTGRRDGRRAEHALKSGYLCAARDRAMPLPLQETHLRDHQNLT
jgi:hypothetical protein